MFTVKYMGILAVEAGTSEEVFKIEELRSSVVQFILEKHPKFRELNFVFALNGVIKHGNIIVAGGDELTLIPPPPGG